MGKSKGADRYAAMFGREATADEHKFFALRESGYKGWINQDNEPAPCPMCETMSCTRDGFAGSCN